jgi:hypothetical protein
MRGRLKLFRLEEKIAGPATAPGALVLANTPPWQFAKISAKTARMPYSFEASEMLGFADFRLSFISSFLLNF